MFTYTENSLALYGRYYEMPQKACERYIFHVMAYAFVSEMPQNRIISISVPFLNHFLITCFFFRDGLLSLNGRSEADGHSTESGRSK